MQNTSILPSFVDGVSLLDIEHGKSTIKQNSNYSLNGAKQHTQQPILTGTSVIGIVYKDGVMMAADCLASYGSLARFRDVRRFTPFQNNTIIGSSGEYSDLQQMQQILESLAISEYCYQDHYQLNTNNVFEYLRTVMYGRRTKMNPLWNSHVIGGLVSGKPFLGYVDLLGTSYKASTIATGFGAYLAQPLLRKAVEGRENEIDEQEALQILENCMRVLFYRDARSLNKIQIAKVTTEGVDISDPYSLETQWDFAEHIRGYGA
ncbi:Proteasome, subunit alpha/beta domain-containing protein [Rozella allomycis CSF55]|uniref:Proteasome subunit beta n=1 Tax=Rozella allomycis (strain CSF55) TaxID=988480 RepID=A0A075AYR4_ROZAC|nr:Proteasome, subunit alpha/beta domain-containing protein [Rozella allomycis CSF55]|eukprot:EPZ33857.1 Proteasome, subunit alpha/beta domain-containing protein [Rozella allomycis CSF55]